MEAVLTSIVLLACPIGMGVMMLFMMRSQKSGGHQPQHGSDATQIEALRAEIAALKAEHGQTGSIQR